MLRHFLFVFLALTLLFAPAAQANDFPQRSARHDQVLYGGCEEFSKSGRDTITLIGPWGSGAQVNGQFQDLQGEPNWNGWTSKDLPQATVSHWSISSYLADTLPGGEGNLAAYCGDETLPACDEIDLEGGYGNHWNELLVFNYTVPDPQANCAVVVSGVFSHDIEPGYDFVHFQFNTAEGLVILASIDGTGTAVPFSHSLSYTPADYLGENHDQVTFQINFKSDLAWSDEDCLHPTQGACQVDDLSVTCSNGSYSSFTDFESGFGDWQIEFNRGVGDFADLWTRLEDIDPCAINYSSQVAFINDGTQVPGVEGSSCIDWCYGPGGYVVNTTGGASEDPAAFLYNAIESPVVTWPGQEYQGGQFTFGVYRHEDLSGDSAGVFYTWSVRSAVDANDLESAPWEDRNFVYFGGPEYFRSENRVTGLLEPGLTAAQVQLTCYELGWVFGYIGSNATPAPYFDNVRFTAFVSNGPAMSTRDIDLANDNFPASGQVDMDNLASNNVRFDNAQNKAIGTEQHNVPGDSITCDISAMRVGGELIENRLHYVMDRNPVFDSVRDPAWGETGYVDARPVVNNGGNLLPNKFAYDLPDSGFLFPGDELHYYFSATEAVNGSDPYTSTLPADLTGFGDFSRVLAWESNFLVRALPSVDSNGDHPSILFWNDNSRRGGEDEWFTAWNNNSFVYQLNYDLYSTNGPSSGVGNGLGGRATPELLAGYSDLIYTAGDLRSYTLSNGDFLTDPSADIQLLSAYVAENSVNMFLCGDNLVSDLRQSGDLTNAFLDNVLNVQWNRYDIRPMINNQTTPLVVPVPGNTVFFTTPNWIAYGACNRINTFDGVIPGEGAERLARFANPSGVADYSFSAATLNVTNDDRIVSLPYDFMDIYTDPSDPAGNGLATRSVILDEIMAYFGYDSLIWNPVHTPNTEILQLNNFPNPFNPVTKIAFNLPQAGRVTLKVFNVKGQLVATLLDEERPAGADFVMWEGKTDSGADVSSGVYFCEVNAAGEARVQKMALIK